MKGAAICCLSAAFVTACAATSDLHAPIASIDYGFGTGIVVVETRRDNDRSVFRIRRTYAYRRGDPDGAWGMPQNFFLMCALADVAAQRSASQMRLTFETDKDGARRPMRNGEGYDEIGADQLYVAVDWLHARSDDAAKAIDQGIIPTTGEFAAFCANLKARAKPGK